MTLRNLVRQVLVAVGALRRDQHGLATAIGRLVTESAEQSRLMAELLAEVRDTAPAGTVTIDVGPVRDVRDVR